jgi:hypothetical protein
LDEFTKNYVNCTNKNGVVMSEQISQQPDINPFRPWAPHDYQAGLLEYAQLNCPDLAYALLQTRHLILMRGKPLSFDPTFIGKQCSMTKAKAERVLTELCDRGNLQLTPKGEIYCETCHNVLLEITGRRENFAKAGRKSGEKRRENAQNQDDKSNNVHDSDELDTNTHTNHTKNLPKQDAKQPDPTFDIDHYLSDQLRENIKRELRDVDFHYVMRSFNEEVRAGRYPMPDNPKAAFITFSRNFRDGVFSDHYARPRA